MTFKYQYGVAFNEAFDSVVNDVDLDVIEIANPYIGLVVTSDVDGRSLTVTAIHRYNGSGRFTCALSDNVNFNTELDVYLSNTTGLWRAKRYIPERYRDEDGVNKAM